MCSAAFFIIHLMLAMLVRLSSNAAVQMARQMKPISAARFLLIARLLPLVMALFALFAFCIPSYLWLEPKNDGEKVALSCVLLAVCGAAIWTAALLRVVGALRETHRYLHDCHRTGRHVTVPGDTGTALVVNNDAAVVAVAGVIRPKLVISRRVLRGLSSEQREAAVCHERAHCSGGDNLKRFLILLAPQPLPFLPVFSSMERAWSKFTEWAADDVATQGDPRRAVSLAAALVRVARMGSSVHRPEYLACSLVGDDRMLSERVERLLRPQSKPPKPIKEVVAALATISLVSLSTATVIVMWPGSLAAVHRALEGLIQ